LHSSLELQIATSFIFVFIDGFIELYNNVITVKSSFISKEAMASKIKSMGNNNTLFTLNETVLHLRDSRLSSMAEMMSSVLNWKRMATRSPTTCSPRSRKSRKRISKSK
jgi:hypothetical protein